MKDRKNNAVKIQGFWRQKKNGRLMLLSKCAVRNNKKLRFGKKIEAFGILNNLRIKTSLIKIPLLGSILYWKKFINERYFVACKETLSIWIVNLWELKTIDLWFYLIVLFVVTKKQVYQMYL